MTVLLHPTSTLADVKDWLRARVDDGTHCPCCGQFSKVYRRPIHHKMAKGLIEAYRAAGTEWFNMPALLQRTGSDEAKLRYWELLEASESQVGWYRVTGKGVDFIHERICVPRYARIYDGRCLGFSGRPVGIRECLGTKFSYAELMSGLPKN